jgi:hypothetical protein
MNDKDEITKHTGQISRLEQAMTALAEAQVKSEDDARELRRDARQSRRDANELRETMKELAKAQVKTEAALAALAEAQTQTTRQFQAYLRTRPTN